MDLTKSVLFFDFDNTITKFDVIDDMLERFSADDKWRTLEEKWIQGKIGSRQCLDGQMRGIRITKKKLDAYLSTIKLDPYFKKILKLCDAKNIKKVILSDNFYYIISKILKNNGINGLELYCNLIETRNGRLTPKFPHTGKHHGKCAHCKTKSLLANVDERSVAIYVGDGLSDVCPAKKADLVFAKSTLAKRLKAEKVPHIFFDGLSDVYEYLKRRAV